MPSILNEKDKELLISSDPINYEAPDNAYLGGSFGTNENDFVEVLIYDGNDNLLESGIVDESDYYYDEEKGGMKLKTGTILRKMGYDRGRFVVKYNFLRRLAGSHETVLTKIDGSIFTGELDLNELGKTIFLKENKYLIHEISPTRTEVRLVTQNIRDEKYIRDFYKLPRKILNYRADNSLTSPIEFKGTDPPEEAKKIGFADGNGQFDPAMIGGKIKIPNFFLRKIIYPEVPLSGEDVGLTTSERFLENMLQASFFMEPEGTDFTINKNTTGGYGDTFFYPAFQAFKDLDIENDNVTAAGVDFYSGDSGTLNNVQNLSDSAFNVVYLKGRGENPIITIVSNSFLPANVATSYTWEVTGYDKDRNAAVISPGWHWDKIAPKKNSQGEDMKGNIEILTGEGYATPSSTNLLMATDTIEPDGETIQRIGSKLRFQIHGVHVHVGIKLTIVENSSLRISKLHLPAIIETH